jgi:hypothetical protein
MKFTETWKAVNAYLKEHGEREAAYGEILYASKPEVMARQIMHARILTADRCLESALAEHLHGD